MGFDVLVDFYVILGRAGGQVAKRKHCRSTIGLPQKVRQADAITWFKNKYDAIVLNR
jgi:large subunit ribosomal protein L11e